MREVFGDWEKMNNMAKEVGTVAQNLPWKLGPKLGETKSSTLAAGGASRHDFLAAAAILTGQFNKEVEGLEPLKSETQRVLAQILWHLSNAVAAFESQLEVVLSQTFATDDEILEMRGFQRHLRRATMELELFEDRSRFFDKDIAVGYSCQLQRRLLDLVTGYNDERLKEWFVEQHGWGKQVILAKGTKRAVVVEAKIQKETDLFPPEIKSLVFEQLDVESCVALRQVDSSWYAAFRDSEPIWEAKLRLRNPWIKPGGGPDLNSWAGCVLVFVARLQKWPTVDDINDIATPTEPAECESVVAVELEGTKKPNSCFSGMVEHDYEHCHPIVCEQNHCATFDYRFDYSLNLWTHEISTLHHPTPELVHSDENYFAIRYKDIGMVLPTSFSLQGIAAVKEGPNYILVSNESGEAALLPRENPHIDSGLSLEPFQYGTPEDRYFFEDMFMTRAQLSVLPDEGRDHRFLIADFHAQKMHVYAIASGPSQPVASYNGLVWWSIHRDCLLPTFIDLQSPRKVYYSAERTMRVPKHEPARIHQGSRSRNCSQFVFGIRHRANVASMVDLATGILTSMYKPRDEPEGKVVPGFQNGRFYPRYLSESACRTWDLFTEEFSEDDGRLW